MYKNCYVRRNPDDYFMYDAHLWTDEGYTVERFQNYGYLECSPPQATHVGLKGKIWKAYQEVQASNMSKSCVDETEAEVTILQRAKEQGEPCHCEQVGDRWVVYRTRDRKVMKSINYFKPDLTQFFTDEEIKKARLGV